MQPQPHFADPCQAPSPRAVTSPQQTALARSPAATTPVTHAVAGPRPAVRCLIALALAGLTSLGGGADWSWPGPARASAEERVALEEDRVTPRVFQLSSHLQVEGEIFPQPGAQSALPLKVDAGFRYRERFLEGAGRQAQSLRSIRFYDQAGASITAGPQVSNSDLRNQTRLIVARGTDLGVELFFWVGLRIVNS